MIVAMNICLTNDTFPPTIDGVANVVKNYAVELTAAGHSCTVVTPEYPDVVDEYPFPVVRFPSLDTTSLIGYRLGDPLNPMLTLKLADTDFDLIHTHCPFASMILGRNLRGALNKPLVFTYHTKYDIEIQKALQSEVMQKAAADILVRNISACDEVWAVSRGAGENLRGMGYQGEYIVMPNGVDLPRARVDECAVHMLKMTHDIPEDRPAFLFVGRMMWYKGIRIILDALKLLQAQQYPFTMIFVGDGMDLEEIRAYAEQLQLMDVCRFIGPVYDREEIRTWYCSADLMLFPSSFDTNGLVVREAAACSLASVLIKESCAAEGIEDGKTGVLIGESADEMAAALVSLSTETMHTLGEQAADTIYLSWADSVHAAAERYAVIQEKWQRREYPNKELPSDELLRFFKDLHDTREDVREHLMTQYMKKREEIRSRIDRYL